MDYVTLDQIPESEEISNVEEEVVEDLAQRDFHITCAESCTGGLLAACIINVSGASTVIDESYITYSDDAKVRILDVDPKVIEKEGVVSARVAADMAYGVAKKAECEVGIGVTGIAGPTGGTADTPVGLVYIGIYFDGSLYCIENHFQGVRDEVRLGAVRQALNQLYRLLNN